MKPESPFYAHCAAALRKSLLFAYLDDAALEAMMRFFQRETWPKGERLPPRQNTELFTIIITGRMELTRINPDTGRQVTIFTLGPGDAFDVISLLDYREHAIDPVALEALELLTAPIASVREWIVTNPAFNRAFLPYLGEKIRLLEDLSADLALTETVTRLAKLILAQATPEPLTEAEGTPLPPLINTLSDETMARMIGSVRAVVNRHIQDFTRMGLISTSRGQLVVHDLNRLQAFCENIAQK